MISDLDTVSGPHEGNSSATQFSFGFRIDIGTELGVYLKTASTEDTLLTEGVDYSLDAGSLSNNDGGSITYPISGTALASGEYITIGRQLPLIQSTSFKNQRTYNPADVEGMGDRGVKYDLMISEKVDRSIKFGISEQAFDTTTPKPEADKFLAINPTNDGFIWASSINTAVALGDLDNTGALDNDVIQFNTTSGDWERRANLTTGIGVFSGSVTAPTFIGNLTGNSAGVHTGNVTGNLTGNSAGVHTGAVVGGTISGTTGTFSGIVKSDSEDDLGTYGDEWGTVYAQGFAHLAKENVASNTDVYVDQGRSGLNYGVSGEYFHHSIYSDTADTDPTNSEHVTFMNVERSGNQYEAGTKAVSNVGKGTSTSITATGHGYSAGDSVNLTGIVSSGSDDLADFLNNKNWTVSPTNLNTNDFEIVLKAELGNLVEQNTSGLTGEWFSGGTLQKKGISADRLWLKMGRAEQAGDGGDIISVLDSIYTPSGVERPDDALHYGSYSDMHTDFFIKKKVPSVRLYDTDGSGQLDINYQNGVGSVIATSVAGDTLRLGGDATVVNLTLSGTGASRLATFAGDVSAIGTVTAPTFIGVLTGNSAGVHTGNVTGNLTGNSAGVHTGNVTGNLTGNSSGVHTGNVTGNVTGNLTGNLTGNSAGVHTGNVTGVLTGNSAGVHTGNVTGDLTGNQSGGSVSCTSLVATGNIEAKAGTSTVPSIRFTGQTTTGFSATSNAIKFITSGVNRGSVNSGGKLAWYANADVTGTFRQLGSNASEFNGNVDFKAKTLETVSSVTSISSNLLPANSRFITTNFNTSIHRITGGVEGQSVTLICGYLNTPTINYNIAGDGKILTSTLANRTLATFDSITFVCTGSAGSTVWFETGYTN